ncbi:quinolinate synthetase [Desulfuromonas soudanensis]|uniref:Quinolinate synthase n=1 Tax=Desulfuromonas soudanensis TaxID=1603606 RepID=A0A0M3QGF7_9BACT|nr:quinolinate synthase NadA [Desulfuromonas soudanensis]ALC17899.1 quinolinate synthetase [Desulfuromonas soudanensis]
MNQEEIKQEIRRLARERDALLLAHNYQRDEIQEVADITGDSLGLSMEAARTEHRVIVFCGVHFMAESAAILAPDKLVLIPRLDAGCPMADMVTVQGLQAMKTRHPGVPVVTYVNSSAAVKAESDICCTSANAVKVVNSLDAQEVILVPDRNLGRYIAAQTDKICHIWEGYCPTHERLLVADVERALAEHPGALFLAHPECPPEVLQKAHHICSTSGMYDYVSTSPAQTFIVGTEAGILYRLRRDNPDKEFILPTARLICPNMKLTSLEDLLHCLQTLSPEVTVPAEVGARARVTLERMLAVPRD